MVQVHVLRPPVTDLLQVAQQVSSVHLPLAARQWTMLMLLVMRQEGWRQKQLSQP